MHLFSAVETGSPKKSFSSALYVRERICKCFCLLKSKIHLEINSRKVFRIFPCFCLLVVFEVLLHSELLVFHFYIYFVNSELVFVKTPHAYSKEA